MHDTTKPYELTFEERDGYLYARIKADTMNREMALAYLGEIADKCAELNCRLLILERDVPVMLPSGDLFFTTQDFMNMMKGRRVAFVNPHSTIENHMDFAITIGTNRGADFALHNTVAAAEKW